MRFALLGDHPDGVAAVRALVATGRHSLVVYSGSAQGLEALARGGVQPRREADLEGTLADPLIEAVIVAGGAASRAMQLRRALQSEHHVLCVHPADPSPDLAYEASTIQSDVGNVLLPLLSEWMHPGIRRLVELGNVPREPQVGEAETLVPLPPGAPRLIEFERASVEEAILLHGNDNAKAGLPGWDVLRFLGGELEEVAGLGRGAEFVSGESLMVTGRFQSGVLLQARWLPRQRKDSWRLALVGPSGTMELLFDDGWPGPARLRYVDSAGQEQTETWPAWNPWENLAATFEAAVAKSQAARAKRVPGAPDPTCLTKSTPELGWLDEIRALELDAAVRRSMKYGRATRLDFPEATEEASFKGTMTLVGCSLLWISLLLLIFSMWLPMLGWLILPIFGLFLALQFLRFVVPQESAEKKP